MRRALAVLAALAAAGLAHAQAFDPLPVLRDYLKIDTSNPPGNEAAAAAFLKTILDREGIPSEIVEVAPGRADLVARLPGTGAKKALILSHHMDVVHADRAKWTADPFGAEIRDGWLYGRGSLDMKTSGILHLAALVRLKREAVPLARDLILVGTADEEVETTGMQALIAKRPDLFKDAELSLTEGDVIDTKGGRVRSWNVDVAEKAVLWLKLTAHGQAGHASTPPQEGTAVTHLTAALDRIARHETPFNVSAAVQRFFSALQGSYPGLAPQKLAHLQASLESDAAFRQAFLADGERAARVRNTIAITVLQGGPQTNVIPSEAFAHLDCRLLPGEDPHSFIEEIRQVVADASITIEPLQPVVATSSSRTDTDLFRAIERVAARRAAGVPVVPTLLTSWTESALLRPLGIQAYGFDPLALDEHEAGLSHGDDERVSLDNVRDGAEILYEIVKEAAK
ncbi:MAG TPA: M20/M25/M40 family metallo-hydrolase [Candidatus Polarisedimenticolaceae bacterium]|nr:M20/M25/M40 family metallo-hydrolase [Candidatus Polarisedimenticolaceae bacterium]